MKHIKLKRRISESGLDVIQHSATILEYDGAEQSESSVTERRRCSSPTIVKTAVGIILTGFIGFVLVDSMTNQLIPDMTKSMLMWCRKNPLEGTIIFTITFIVGVVCFIPGTLFVLGAGYVFAHVYGGLTNGALASIFVSVIATSTGGILSFFLGRYLLKDCLSPSLQKYKLLKVLDKAMHEHGLRIMALLHLNPIVPFNILNYLAGVTSMKSKDYYFAVVGTVPGIILYSFLGASAQNIAALEHAGKDEAVTIGTIVVGVIAGFAVVWLMARYAKKELEVLEAQYALEEDDIEGNVRPSTTVSTHEMDDWQNHEAGKQIEVVSQRSQEKNLDEVPRMV